MEEPQEQAQEQQGASGRRKALPRIVVGIVAVIALIAIGVFAVRGFHVEGDGGTWYAYTDYGTEQRLVLGSDKSARLGAMTGTWEESASGNGYLVSFAGEDAIDFEKDADKLQATVHAVSPEVDDSSSEGSEEEQLVFYPSESDARSDYDARLSSWKQELADYEAELSQALVGAWQHDMRKTSENGSAAGSSAIVFSDDGTYQLAHEDVTSWDSWTGKCWSKVKKASGTWRIDESGITDAHMKFFRSHLAIRVSKARKLEKSTSLDASYRKVRLADENDPTSIRLGKKAGWEKAQADASENAVQLVKGISVSSAAGDSHKKTLCNYTVWPIGSNRDYTHDTHGTFADYDLDADGSKDTLEYSIGLRKYGEGEGDSTITEVTVGVNGQDYSLEGTANAWGCTLGLLTMDNGASFVFVDLSGEDDDGEGALLQYRDGELGAVASIQMLGEGIRHAHFESVTTSGSKVDVTFVGQPMYTGIMYFGYELEYADGRLSSASDTTSSLEYASMAQLERDSVIRPGHYKMKANKKVTCRSDASSSSGTALTVKKGQRVTFEQAKVVGSTIWFHVKRVSDGAEGWFANGTDSEEPLPFAGFVQAG